MDDPERIRKLRWLCRRGMKELDILLERFITANPDKLASGEWPTLETMLGAEDDVLWDWIQNPETAPDPAVRDLLGQIRSNHAGSH